MSISTDYSSGFDYYYSPLSDSASREEFELSGESVSQLSKTEKKEQTGEDELSDEEKKEVQELKKRDLEVRAHEQAHVAAGGAYVRGGPSFSYQTGPDGKRYAIGGEVSIDTSSVSGDPEATIRKMQVVRKAALAPGSPSSTDRSVAAAASQKMNSARMELAKERSEGSEENENGGNKGISEKSSNYNEKGVSTQQDFTTGALFDIKA